MVKKIILDLDRQYIREKAGFICQLKDKYVVEYGDAASLQTSDTVVLTDKCAAEHWEKYAVIGIEHLEKISGVSYVLGDLEDLTAYDVELVYARKFQLPLVVAKDEEITIREITTKDIPELNAIYNDSEIKKYVPLLEDMETEIEKAAAYIQYMYGFYGYGMWIIEDNHTGTVIGRAGIEHRNIDGITYCELGYLVRKEYRGRGYGYQAAQMVLCFAKKYGMEELITYIHEKNIPSIRLSQKLGFTFWKEVTDGTGKYYIYKIKNLQDSFMPNKNHL